LPAPDPPQQRVRLEAAAFADLARRVRAITRQQHADMHLVGLAFQPVEIVLYAIPGARPGFLPVHPFRLAVDHPALLCRAQVPPGFVERNAALLRILDEVVLAFLETLRLPGFHRAAAKRFRLVWNHQPVIDADDTAEAAAGVAGADRRVEREGALARLAIVNVAVGTMKRRGKLPDGLW